MNRVKNICREPLLHFLVLGVGLFWLFGFFNGPVIDKPNRIVVTPGQVELLAENFSRTWMRPPSEQELDGLIQGYLRDEVFYREAIALGLDQEDDLIRRRMRQKLEFILEDVSALVDPTDEELITFMRQHEDKFRQQPQVSFRHIYLSPDKRNDIHGDAVKLLASLQAGENPDQLGDQIMLDDELPLVSQTDIERRFGDEFARQIVSLQPGVWTGPVLSGFGGHLVLVSERVEGRVPDLAEVREAVQRDWLLEQRKMLKEATYRKLLEEYEIVMQQSAKPDYVPGSAVAATRSEGWVQ